MLAGMKEKEESTMENSKQVEEKRLMASKKTKKHDEKAVKDAARNTKAWQRGQVKRPQSLVTVALAPKHCFRLQSGAARRPEQLIRRDGE